MLFRDRVRLPQAVRFILLYLLALFSIGCLAYSWHLLMVWQHGGVWCRQVEKGMAIRRYGDACQFNPRRASPKITYNLIDS